ncbi:MAG: hypothetical protein ABW220_01740 [Burkholderiaceae bacterium]
MSTSLHPFKTLARWLMLALALLTASASWARDDGQWQIMHARYGTADRNVDVTGRLRELAGQDRRFKLTNGLFGVDPAYGQEKVLRIYARSGRGDSRTFEYREGHWIDGEQFTGWGRGNWGQGGWNGGWEGPRPGQGNGGGGDRDDGAYQILQARYGVADRNIDVTSRLRDLARRDQRFKLTNDLFHNDPAYGQRKTLRIYARGRGGEVRTFEYGEGSTIDGNQFTGWGRGDWGGGGGWNGGWDGRPGGDSQGGGQSADQRLTIVRATYGAGTSSVDVTQRLRNASRGGRLDLKVNNDLSGRDPAYGQVKSLHVYYTIGRGREQHVEVREGQQVRLP